MTDQEATLKLVRDFIDLNQEKRDRDLSSEEVGRWYDLKKEIEEALFSHPPYESDQRQSIRIGNLKNAVRFHGAYEDVEGYVKEVSEGGLFVSTQDPIPVGADVELTVSLNLIDGMEDQEITVPVRVVYNNVAHSMSDKAFSGMGMALTDEIAEEEQGKWQQWVDHLVEKLPAMVDA